MQTYKELTILGTVGLDVREDFERFSHWLSQKKNASMSYLENHSLLRAEPSLLLEGAQCATVVALPYYQNENSDKLPKIAQYARFKDYHRFMREKVEEYSRYLHQGKKAEWRVLVDSAPVLERALARKVKRGFIGKNTFFIHEEAGSFLLLAEILSTYPFPIEEESGESLCGSCTSCQVVCPTGALNEDYVLDSSKCLAYWTIEHRGPIPETIWPYLADYVFGCDLCQSVCPFNKEARKNELPSSIPVKNYPALFETATMTQEKYEIYFGGTPMTRAKRDGLRRNALIALWATKSCHLREALNRTEEDCSEELAKTVLALRERMLIDRY